MPATPDFDGNYDDETSLIPDLKRRVRNLALGPSAPSNALIPMFEAVYNALHAVNDRFKDDWAERGVIAVSLIGFDGPRRSVEVRDNGIGLDDKNYASFRTYDSDWKLKRGGKGVGRLSWLKVFEGATVLSRYKVGKQLQERSFDFVLDNARPIRNYHNRAINTLNGEVSDTGTTVTLQNMRAEYVSRMPTQIDTIIRKLIAHFLPYLMSSSFPKITVETDEDTVDLGEFLREKKHDFGSFSFTGAEGETLKLNHNLLERGIVEGKASHKLYFTAHDRVVAEFDIGNTLGLTTYIEERDGKHVYAGVLSGEFLDNTVNSERTSFDFDQYTLDTIKRLAIAQIGNALHFQIERVIAQQTELTRQIVKKYPRYSYLIENPREFAETKMPRNFRSAEQVYQQLALYDFRENREVERRVEALSKNAANASEDTIEAGVQAILSKLSQQEYSVLADYTVKRKVVLDLLERRLGYKPNGELKHEAEAALHSFVVPMRVENQQVRVDDHNLWIIDDKLTYYEYWASDRKLRTFINGSNSDDRPDVVLFTGRSAYHRPGTDQPVVIIEFKKPVRNDYDDDENPFTQIYSYIEDMRAHKVLDKSGGQIQEVTDNTPFFCYIIADITPNMKKWLRMAQINVPLPGGSGYYGFNANYNAFIQALSYKYVLKDARLRNEAFFKRLKI
ncbi:ATP-binding protein [Methylobacterium sp. J-059]|uniref:ATP-binding protein n=1 Tax=Methylobacterium sp. J-059 TaxID=2836643 RepID=UPI001FB91D34|nr:ATP-binding protein [Methylobacterium sp. J-059]MCJ2040415.1 ATP-binding protein [Methylobacterium sp. J-059]